jgi:GTPase KRas protein
LERFLYQGDGFLIVYSITRRSSFSDLADYREHILRLKESSLVPIVLVGNKCDLESEREVTAAEGAELAKSFGCEFFEVSAITGINVEQSFSALVRELQCSKPANQESNTTGTKKGCTLC